MNQREISSKGLHLFIVVLLILGIFFRFVNIDYKISWVDEYHTLIAISGINPQKIYETLVNQEISIEDLHKSLQSLLVHTNVGLIDVIKNSMTAYPEHPPFYYALARLGAERFGNTVVVARTASAFISLFVFPCIYWLCWELFGSSLAGWIGIALMAVSPFHVLYAQEAREYCLWAVTILLSSAAFLRAMRFNTKLSWITYAATLALGLYSNLFFALVAIAQGIYVVVIEGFRLSKTLATYVLASIPGLLAFAPWIWLFISKSSERQEIALWMMTNPSLLTMVKRWVGNLSRVFFDFGFDESASFTDTIFLIPLILILLILVGYSIYFLCRHAPKRVWLFVLTLIVVPTLPFVVVDLISGTISSGTARYLVPCYLGVQLAVIYLFTTKLTYPFSNNWQRKLWQLIAIALISSGILSLAISSQAQTWWVKGESKELLQISPIINQANQPLVISDINLAGILPLTYELEPNVRINLVSGLNYPSLSKIPANVKDVFLFRPSEEMLQAFAQDYKVEPLNNGSTFPLCWKLENNTSGENNSLISWS